MKKNLRKAPINKISAAKKVAKKAKIKMADEVVFSTKEGEWVDGKKGYTPSQVSSLILSKLKDYTSGVKKVVITVPAHFAEASRTATLDAAKLSGINNNKYKIIGFITTSMLVGVSGIILASLMDTGQQGSAKGFELIVIAAVLLGGTSFMGGSGTIIGTILGILIS